MTVVYGVGIHEKGIHKSVDECSKHTKLYTVWKNMLARCYSNVMHKHRPTYEICEVQGSFLNFQTFCDWYVAQALDDTTDYQLDKDLLNKGNKIYSEEFCILVPRKINARVRPNVENTLLA